MVPPHRSMVRCSACKESTLEALMVCSVRKVEVEAQHCKYQVSLLLQYL